MTEHVGNNGDNVWKCGLMKIKNDVRYFAECMLKHAENEWKKKALKKKIKWKEFWNWKARLQPAHKRTTYRYQCANFLEFSPGILVLHRCLRDSWGVHSSAARPGRGGGSSACCDWPPQSVCNNAMHILSASPWHSSSLFKMLSTWSTKPVRALPYLLDVQDKGMEAIFWREGTRLTHWFWKPSYTSVCWPAVYTTE